MATIQQSIEVGVPVHTAYHQLTQFEHYPRFMQYVDAVQQTDDTHLHWSTRMPHRNMEWDSEITEQLPDRCIAWRNVSGPASTGKVELQPTGAGTARVTLTMECDPLQFAPAQDGNADIALTHRIEQDLVRFKKLVETPGLQGSGDAAAQGSGATAGKTIGQSGAEQRDASQMQSPAAGAEGWSGDEDPLQPVVSATQNLAQPPSPPSTPAAGTQADKSALSPNSLSQSSADRNTEEQFNVAEEQSFDQQSSQARQIGQMPRGADAGLSNANPVDALEQSMKQEKAKNPKRRKPSNTRPSR